jgi:acyl-CoA reductase-like NAD-dependent aldehyde dehydrogenase
MQGLPEGDKTMSSLKLISPVGRDRAGTGLDDGPPGALRRRIRRRRTSAPYMAGIAEALADIEIERQTHSSSATSCARPHGVVFVIAPWNYPYMTAINTVAPALIAGNTVVLKHATQTLLVGERMARAFHAAGVPEDVFQNVFLDHDTTAGLIGGGLRFRQFHRLGLGGQAIERAAAGTFTALGLELGGKDPGYVMETPTSTPRSTR